MIDLRLGDCLDLLPTLEAQSVDAVIADIPYGTTACKWDTVIPFEPMWEQLKRIAKPKAAIVLFGSQPFTSALVMSNMEWFRHDWVWNKKSPSDPLNVKRRPMRQHESICVFSENGHTYNPQLRKEVTVPFGKVGNPRRQVQGNSKDSYKQGVGYPLSILNYAKPNNLSGGCLHPTQKPVALMEYLIKTYTNEGDTVLDFTMGSGTTMVACVNTKRNGIGFELRQDYYEIAQKRVAEAQRQMVML